MEYRNDISITSTYCISHYKPIWKEFKVFSRIKHNCSVVRIMSYLPAKGTRKKNQTAEDILPEYELEAIACFLRDHDNDILDLSQEDLLSIINIYRSAGNKLIPTFSFPTRRSARLIQQAKKKRNDSDDYE